MKDFAIWWTWPADVAAAWNWNFGLQVLQMVFFILSFLFIMSRVLNLVENDASSNTVVGRRQLNEAWIEENGLFMFGLTHATRRLANQPQEGFFCDVVHESPTAYPTKLPVPAPTTKTPYPTVTTSPPTAHMPTPGPTKEPTPGDDDTVFLCDTTDQGLLYFGFALWFCFSTVWLYRLCVATTGYPVPAGEDIPDDEKVMWKVKLTYCTPKYVWNVASQVGHALPTKPGLDQRIIGGFANINTANTHTLTPGNFETITFNASKSAIDRLNDGIFILSTRKGANGLFTRYEHEVACAMMHQGEGGPLAVRMLNQQHAPQMFVEKDLYDVGK